jgi:hypothetical protein
VAEDLSQYLDSWADLLAANLDRRLQESGAQSSASLEGLRSALSQAIAETRSTLSGDVGRLREDVTQLRDDVTGVAGTLATSLDRTVSALGGLGQAVASVDGAIGRVDKALVATREDTTASRDGVERLEHELTRANDALDTIQDGFDALHKAIVSLPQALNTALTRDLAASVATERQEREAAEFAALDDILAALDGLEPELEAGRQLLLDLAGAPRPIVVPDPTGFRGSLIGMWRSAGKSLGVPDAPPPAPPMPASGVERLVDGLQHAHRRLEDALARRGVTPIEAVGQPFDPNFHEAVATEACSRSQDGLVLREERRGYRTEDTVVRLAHVVVGRANT